MSNLLYKFLEKRGIKDREQLSASEKATFEKWEKIFSKEITMVEVLELVDDSIEILQEEWLKLEEKEEKNPFSYLFYWKQQLYIKARIKNLLMIKDLFKNNNSNKKSLEFYLKDLLKK